MRTTRALVFAAACFVAVFVLGTALVERHAPSAIDPEYVARRDRLRAQVAADPDRPAVLVVGSSRVVMAFAPEQLPPLRTYDGRAALAFNFGHVGAGPTLTRVVLGRLFRDGFRPKCVVIELMPTFLCRERHSFLARFLTAADVATAAGYTDPADLTWKYLRHRATDFPATVRCAAGLDEQALQCGQPGPLGGPQSLREAADDEYRARRTAEQHDFNGIDEFRVPPGLDRAVRDSVALCRANGADVRLLLMPEGPAYRTCYGPGCERAFEDYAANLAAELGAPLIDARGWLAEEDFVDSHHVLKRGAEHFTARLGGEVLGPMIAGW